MSELIKGELAKSPVNYSAVDFSKAFEELENIYEAIVSEKDTFVWEDLSYDVEKTLEYINNQERKLYAELADALLANSIKLSNPIIDAMLKIPKYNEELQHFEPEISRQGLLVDSNYPIGEKKEQEINLKKRLMPY